MNNKILSAFNFRHACKDFLPDKKISKDDFQIILESGHLSPSSFGFEPWKFLVIQDPTLREKIKEVSWGGGNQIPNSSHFVLVLARKGKDLHPTSEYIQNIMKEVQELPPEVVTMKTKFFTQFQEEDFKLKNDEALFDWAKRQTYIPLANMMTTAALLEIDSCPIEGFHEEQLNAILEKDFGINTEEFGVSVMVTFGYRVTDPRSKTRQKLEQVVSWF